jgi:glycosyltransferase involved in cell wall biosynthesis
MKRPVVSVIIPAYNSKRYIEETINSVLAQTYTDFEMIVVDDGSTDSQRDCIFQYCKADDRVRYVYQQNKGVSAARNTGFNHSTGDYVAFLDSDDVWMPNNLSAKLAKFESGNFGLVHSDGFLIDENSQSKEGVMVGREGSLLTDMLEWSGTQVPGPSSILVKREVLQSIGLFDTNLSTSADHDFFLRVAFQFKIGRVPKPTWKYRLHDANMHKIIPLMEKDVLFVYRKASDNNLFKSFWFEKACYATMYLILAASWAGDGGNKTRATYFVLRALIIHPSSISNIINRISKRWR